MIPEALSILFPPHCFGCKKEGVVLCERCLKLTRKSLGTPAPYIESCYDFRDPLIKRAIHAVKYKHRKELLQPLTLYATSLYSILKHTNKHVLVPIPMTRFRKLLRGYNHAEKIATILTAISSIPTRADLLTRSKHTKRQALSSKKEARLQNQKGSFAAGNVSGLHIVLIDDVTTTGATLEEARNTLLQAGAASVRACTLAH